MTPPDRKRGAKVRLARNARALARAGPPAAKIDPEEMRARPALDTVRITSPARGHEPPNPAGAQARRGSAYLASGDAQFFFSIVTLVLEPPDEEPAAAPEEPEPAGAGWVVVCTCVEPEGALLW